MTSSGTSAAGAPPSCLLQPLGLPVVDHEVHGAQLGRAQAAGVVQGLDDGQVEAVHQDVDDAAGVAAVVAEAGAAASAAVSAR